MLKSRKKYHFAQTCILIFYNPHGKFYTFSKELLFTIQIFDSLFFSSWIPPGVSMRLKFIRNSDNFVIIADKNDDFYKIKLVQLYVEFRKIKVDTSILSHEMAALERGEPYVIPFIQGKQVIHTVPSGRLSFVLSELFTGPLPKQVIIAFVSHASYNGNCRKNPYVFENLNIKSLVFKINGENSPPTEYTPNFGATPLDCVRGNIH